MPISADTRQTRARIALESVLLSRRPTVSEGWSEHEGPRGGHYWLKDGDPESKRYQDDSPGEGTKADAAPATKLADDRRQKLLDALKVATKQAKEPAQKRDGLPPPTEAGDMTTLSNAGRDAWHGLILDKFDGEVTKHAADAMGINRAFADALAALVPQPTTVVGTAGLEPGDRMSRALIDFKVRADLLQRLPDGPSDEQYAAAAKDIGLSGEPPPTKKSKGHGVSGETETATAPDVTKSSPREQAIAAVMQGWRDQDPDIVDAIAASAAAIAGPAGQDSPETDLYRKHREVFDAVLSSMHKATQDRLAEAGIEGMVLYRKIPISDGQAEAWLDNGNENASGVRVHDQPVKLRDMSTWHTSPAQAAAQFGQWHDNALIVSTYVPREKILSTAITGLGDMATDEILTVPFDASGARIAILGPEHARTKDSLEKLNAGFWDGVNGIRKAAESLEHDQYDDYLLRSKLVKPEKLDEWRDALMVQGAAVAKAVAEARKKPSEKAQPQSRPAIR